MHRSVQLFVADKVESLGLDRGKVLEVGSLDVNGSVREYFDRCDEYTGVDMRPGEGVDVVANAHKLPFLDAVFDTVLSCEMLEHDDRFWISVAEMGRVLKPGGVLILTARGNGFKPHAYPDDYYRFMPSAFRSLIKMAGCAVLEIIEDPEAAGVFGVGRKE